MWLVLILTLTNMLLILPELKMVMYPALNALDAKRSLVVTKSEDTFVKRQIECARTSW